jgi:hypothetical protein
MGINSESVFPFRKKRQRSSPEQLQILEDHFIHNPMPSHLTRIELAVRLNMTPRRIQVWFQNKRAKLRRAVRDGETFAAQSDPDPEEEEEEEDGEIQKAPKP